MLFNVIIWIIQLGTRRCSSIHRKTEEWINWHEKRISKTSKNARNSTTNVNGAKFQLSHSIISISSSNINFQLISSVLFVHMHSSVMHIYKLISVVDILITMVNVNVNMMWTLKKKFNDLKKRWITKITNYNWRKLKK